MFQISAVSLLAVFFLSNTLAINKTITDSQLLLVHVLFSNGEIALPTYSGDPYEHYPRFPLNHGELTEEGQLSSYRLGQQLRNIYNGLLGDVFLTNLSQSFTSNFPHTEESLQCLLAGLFPPKGVQKIAEFDWQPVAYTILKKAKDILSAFQQCNTTNWNLKPDQNFADIYEDLSQKTGHKVSSNEDVFNIYNAIINQKKLNLTIPDWVTTEMLQDLEIISNAFYDQLVQERMKIGIGPLIQKIITLSLDKTNGTLQPAHRKMCIYSAETSNIILMLNALGNNFKDNFPKDSACLLLELHKLNEQIGFKMFYHSGSSEQTLMQMNILDCGQFCSLDYFVAKTRTRYEPAPECVLI